MRDREEKETQVDPLLRALDELTIMDYVSVKEALTAMIRNDHAKLDEIRHKSNRLEAEKDRIRAILLNGTDEEKRIVKSNWRRPAL